MRKESPDVPPALSAWIAELASVWPHLSRPQVKILAQYSLGMVLAEGSGLSRVSFCLAHWLGQTFNRVRERLRDFYCNAEDKSGRRRRELVVEQCFAGLLAWILKSWPRDQLAIAMDATNLGNRFVVLAISVVYAGSAIPVAWRILPATAPGEWKPHWLELLGLLHGIVPKQMHVIVLADRGLYAKWLFEAIVALGWHPFLRINIQNAEFQPANTGPYQPVSERVPPTGQIYRQAGVLFRSDQARLPCTLLACWSQGYEEPWLIVTDLVPGQAEPAWYGLRAWIERGFKHSKSGGWGWEHTRMTNPQRSERLWLVMAIAQVLVMRQETLPTDGPNIPGTSPSQEKSNPQAPTSSASRVGRRRCYPILSVFLRGLLSGRMLLCAGLVPNSHRLSPAAWPTGLPVCTAHTTAHPQLGPRPP
jgi:hypothetical protein